MLTVDKKKFWEKYIQGFAAIHERVDAAEHSGVEAFLDKLSRDPRITSVRHAAYMLVTARWEQDRFKAPRERGSEAYLRYLLGKLGNSANPSRRHHILYRGGGPCHTTGLDNYRFVDKKLGLNGELVAHPEKITDVDVAYETMVRGHLEGWFSGGRHKLEDYFDNSVEDPKGARAIINGGELNIANRARPIAYKKRTKRQQQCIEAIDSQVKWYFIIQSALRGALSQTASPPEVAPVEDDVEYTHLDQEVDIPEAEEVEEPPAPDEDAAPTLDEPTIATNDDQRAVQSTQSQGVTAGGQSFDFMTVASSGMTKIGNRLNFGLLTSGAFTTVTAFIHNNWMMLAFAVLLILLGLGLWAFIYFIKHKEKRVEAEILADKSKGNVKFER